MMLSKRKDRPAPHAQRYVPHASDNHPGHSQTSRNVGCKRSVLCMVAGTPQSQRRGEPILGHADHALCVPGDAELGSVFLDPHPDHPLPIYEFRGFQSAGSSALGKWDAKSTSVFVESFARAHSSSRRQVFAHAKGLRHESWLRKEPSSLPDSTMVSRTHAPERERMIDEWPAAIPVSSLRRTLEFHDAQGDTLRAIHPPTQRNRSEKRWLRALWCEPVSSIHSASMVDRGRERHSYRSRAENRSDGPRVTMVARSCARRTRGPVESKRSVWWMGRSLEAESSWEFAHISASMCCDKGVYSRSDRPN